ncbi:nuclear transport factor 2 family protein [Streptomyces violaceusniger]|uniref:SnoaL-like domain-containing protein n=1 Tax=Streptomyces violaceusniger TaxID=68280 RepID=A0A4D4LI74_STRVO|nr:hypothetical protein SVIO_095990 [Streptomyces violaceusniger]
MSATPDEPDETTEKFACLVRARAHPGRGDDLIAAYAPVFAQVDEETATELFTLIRSVDDPDQFFCFEVFSSRAAFDAHRAHALEGDTLDEVNAATAQRDFIWGIPVRSKASGEPRPAPGGPAPFADRLAIEDLIVDYAKALDTQDWDLLRSCFLPDARSTMDTVGTLDSCEALIDELTDRLEVFDALQHFVTNMAVRVDGDTATALASFVSHHVPRDAEPYTYGGTFAFDLVRGPGGWRFGSHTCRILWELGNATRPQ